MNTSIQVEPGATPAFGNFYVVSWSLLNLILIIAIALSIIRYFKQKKDFRRQLLNRLDTIISLIQHQKTDND
ncbi:MAG TPA: hypothetical protein VN426_12195 [Syntrophomonadaceae bacterium]|nr:hypothetical protein [Syntrophomonadaceae bacterium]